MVDRFDRLLFESYSASCCLSEDMSELNSYSYLSCFVLSARILLLIPSVSLLNLVFSLFSSMIFCILPMSLSSEAITSMAVLTSFLYTSISRLLVLFLLKI